LHSAKTTGDFAEGKTGQGRRVPGLPRYLGEDTGSYGLWVEKRVSYQKGVFLKTGLYIQGSDPGEKKREKNS